MVGILSQTTNPAFNLAAEEYLLKDMSEDVFYLYVNEPAIVVGKHQNTLAEINYIFTQKNNIPVYRRLSGGGTVYHDLGNLNFCFITNEEKGNLVNFDKHSAPIVKALEGLGVKVESGKRHDLSIAGKKITGTASHVFRNRAMHHGTLLFSADLSVLNKCLNAEFQKFKGKAVKSVRSEVTNISEHLDRPVTMDEFTVYLFNFLKTYFSDVQILNLSKEKESVAINDLVKEKYSTWKWNYGYSPHYELSGKIELHGETVNSEVKVEKGLISNISFKSEEGKTLSSLTVLAKALNGVQHNPTAVLNCLKETTKAISGEQLVRMLF
jgi:lipoate-protein ligase A